MPEAFLDCVTRRTYHRPLDAKRVPPPDRPADLRRRLTWKQHGRRARKGDAVYTVRKLLRANAEDLTDDQHTLLTSELTTMGTFGKQILAAWQAKELLRDLLRLAPTRSKTSSSVAASVAVPSSSLRCTRCTWIEDVPTAAAPGRVGWRGR